MTEMDVNSNSARDRKHAAELRALRKALESTSTAIIDKSKTLNEVGRQYLNIISDVINECEEAFLYAELIVDKGGNLEEEVPIPELIDLKPFLAQIHSFTIGKLDSDDDSNVEEDDSDDGNHSGRLKRGTVLYGIVPALREAGSVKTPAQIIQIVSDRLHQSVPSSTVTNSLTRLIRANKLKKTTDSSTSYYGLPEWFEGDSLKKQFIDERDEFSIPYPGIESLKPIIEKIKNELANDEAEEYDEKLISSVPFDNSEDDLPF